MTAIVALETKALGMVLKDFASRERDLSTDFLIHLVEFDNRRGWVEFECSSLWDFCTRELRLLGCATAQRIRAVKILRQFPQVEAYLRDGRLSVTSMTPLLSILTEENATALFDRCSGLSRKQVVGVVEKVIAEATPSAGPPASLRLLPEKTVRIERPVLMEAAPPPRPEPAPIFESDLPEAAPRAESGTDDTINATTTDALVLVAQVARRLSVTMKPVNAREYAMNATVDQNFVDLLEEATNLYSHVFPEGNPVEILRRALQTAIEEKLKKKAAKTSTPRASRASDEDVLTADTKRVVWERDGGCCAWRHADGSVCGSQWMLEFDHILPPKLGGSSKPENVRVTCRDHNQQHARNTYGDALIERKKEERKRTKD